MVELDARHQALLEEREELLLRTQVGLPVGRAQAI